MFGGVELNASKGECFMGRKMVVSVVAALFCGVFLISSAYAAEATAKKKIVFKKYPDFKIGVLANNFLKPLPLSKDNLKKVFDWASAKGFSWVEIRDPKATLTYDESKELAAYAATKRLEVLYALNIGLLDPQFNEVFYRGCANAALFAARGPRVIRTSLPGPEFNADPKKATWTKEEFDKILSTANNAANVAKLMGLQFVLEHAAEAMQGDGTATFGIVDLFAKGNTNIGSQYDTANFFAVSRAPVTTEVAKAYFEKYANRTYYMHIKTSDKDHKVPDITSDNELDFGVIFDILAKAKINYLALEIPQQAKFEDCASNVMKSIDYLKSKY